MGRTNQPDISVLIPTFNNGKTLRACLGSIIRQTIKPKEVLVCDGGSTDATLRILADYSIIQIVGYNVKGVGRARNLLSRSATGKILAWVDADVTVPLNWLEIHWNFHQKHPVVDSLSNLTSFVSLEDAIVSMLDKIPVKKLEFHVDQENISQSAFSIKKSSLMRVGGYDSNVEWGEEVDLKIRLKKDGVMFRTETVLAFHVREHGPNNMSARDLLFSGNFTYFLFKYGLRYILQYPQHWGAYILREWLLYSLILSVFYCWMLLVFGVCVGVNLFIGRMHQRSPVRFLFEQFLKALGESYNLVKVLWLVFHRES